MARLVAVILLASATAGATACFGDNDSGASVQLRVPGEMDGGESADITVEFKSAASAQFSVAVDSVSGAFSPQNKVGITDASGASSFVTRYTADNKTATVEIAANFTGAGGVSETVTKQVSVYEVERIGNIAPILVRAEETDYLTAYPLDLTAGTLRKLAIVAPTAATALIGLYSNAVTINGDAPSTALARVTATLVPGANEVVVPAQPITAGKYWMVVTYSGKTTAARGAATAEGRFLMSYGFDRGLPDPLPAMTLTTDMGKRNFYVVLRK
jgi:hypothetical protein